MSAANAAATRSAQQRATVNKLVEAISLVREIRNDFLDMAAYFSGRKDDEVVKANELGDMLRAQQSRLDRVLTLAQPWAGGGS